MACRKDITPNTSSLDHGKGSTSPSSSSSSSSRGPARDNPEWKRLQYMEKTVLKSVHYHPDSWPFREPVDTVAFQIPEYFTVIKHPMDLSTIRNKLKNQQYHTAEECIYDFRLIFDNCYKFNYSDDIVVQLAKSTEKLFGKKIKKLPSAKPKVPKKRGRKRKQPQEEETTSKKTKRIDSEMKESTEKTLRKMDIEMKETGGNAYGRTLYKSSEQNKLRERKILALTDYQKTLTDNLNDMINMHVRKTNHNEEKESESDDKKETISAEEKKDKISVEEIEGEKKIREWKECLQIITKQLEDLIKEHESKVTENETDRNSRRRKRTALREEQRWRESERERERERKCERESECEKDSGRGSEERESGREIVKENESERGYERDTVIERENIMNEIESERDIVNERENDRQTDKEICNEGEVLNERENERDSGSETEVYCDTDSE